MNPRWLMRFHATATAVWILLIVPSVLWWRESVPWIVAMSVWANVGAHFSAWQSTRIETQQTEAMEDR